MTAFSESLGVPVEIGSIEAELKNLWEKDDASTNASLMNFAVFCEEAASLHRNSELIQTLIHEHACRAILIGRDRAAPRAIRAWITTHCRKIHGQRSICCEQVSFLLQGEAVGRLRNVIFAHLASDLPLVFWWQGELSELFEPALYRMIDQLFFDSAGWVDPEVGYARVEQAAESRARIVMQDLAWTRGHQFRLAVAAFFDEPVAQRALAEIESVCVRAGSGQRTTALLLVAWLATQAGWQLASDPGLETERREDEGACFTMESKSGRSIEVKVNCDGEGAGLSRLELRAADCLVQLEREAGENFLRQRLETPGHLLERRGPADEVASVDLVADQLSRGGRNKLFRKVRPFFLELLGAK